jgi:hypothetical protein
MTEEVPAIRREGDNLVIALSSIAAMTPEVDTGGVSTIGRFAIHDGKLFLGGRELTEFYVDDVGFSSAILMNYFSGLLPQP